MMLEKKWLKFILILVITILFSGCTELESQTDSLKDAAMGELDKVQETADSHASSDSDIGQPLNEYFGKDVEVYFDKPLEMNIDCISGNCPDSSELLNTESKAQKCFFCQGGTFIKGDKASINIGRTGGGDGNTACHKKYDVYGTRTEPFDIIEKTEDKIVVEVIRTGHVTQTGDGTNCDNYEYDWESISEWTFYNNPPSIDVRYAPGLSYVDGKNLGLSASAESLSAPVTITCTHPEGVNAVPYFVLTSVEGRDVFKNPSGIVIQEIDRERIISPDGRTRKDSGKATFKFKSFYGGTYVLEPECRGGLTTTRSDTGIKFVVSSGDKGHIPEDRYMQYTAE